MECNLIRPIKEDFALGIVPISCFGIFKAVVFSYQTAIGIMHACQACRLERTVVRRHAMN